MQNIPIEEEEPAAKHHAKKGYCMVPDESIDIGKELDLLFFTVEESGFRNTYGPAWFHALAHHYLTGDKTFIGDVLKQQLKHRAEEMLHDEHEQVLLVTEALLRNEWRGGFLVDAYRNWIKRYNQAQLPIEREWAGD